MSCGKDQASTSDPTQPSRPRRLRLVQPSSLCSPWHSLIACGPCTPLHAHRVPTPRAPRPGPLCTLAKNALSLTCCGWVGSAFPASAPFAAWEILANSIHFDMPHAAAYRLEHFRVRSSPDDDKDNALGLKREGDKIEAQEDMTHPGWLQLKNKGWVRLNDPETGVGWQKVRPSSIVVTGCWMPPDLRPSPFPHLSFICIRRKT